MTSGSGCFGPCAKGRDDGRREHTVATGLYRGYVGLYRVLYTVIYRIKLGYIGVIEGCIGLYWGVFRGYIGFHGVI